MVKMITSIPCVTGVLLKAFNMNSYESVKVASVMWSARFYAYNLSVQHKFLFVTDICIMLTSAVMQTCYDSFSRSQAQQFMLLICDCDISLPIGGCNVEAITRIRFLLVFSPQISLLPD